ncbi:MAG: endonuclease III [Candidatus Pacearchaeota archaeon]
MDNPKRIIKQIKELEKRGMNIRLAAESWDSDFKILISTILSARTRDEVTIKVAEKLFKKYGDVRDLAKSKLKDIRKIIMPVNFYKNKSKNIVNCAKILVKKYNGKIPHEINELIKLPGVGRKTANVFLTQVGRQGLAVDTHVAYCSRKLGWTKQRDPKKIEEELKKIIPKKYWNKVNPIIVRFGKTYANRKQKDKILREIIKIR